MNKKETIVITGSSGWLSQNFLRILDNKFSANKEIITISSENDWKKITQVDNDIHLIHNAFILPQSNKVKSSQNYQEQLENLFEDTKEFIKNNNIKSLFYPSSGLVNMQKNKDSDIYSIYKEQKLKEEKQFTQLSTQNNFTLVISRIFSLIGPFSSPPPKSSFISLMSNAIESNKIVIEGETNDTHSVCFLDHLVHIVIDLLANSKQGSYFIFDAVDITISLKNFSLHLANSLGLKEKDIECEFKTNQKTRKYAGNETLYKSLLNKSDFTKHDISSYLAKIIDN